MRRCDRPVTPSDNGHHARELVRPVRCVFEQVVGDVFEIRRSFFRPTKLHSRAALFLGRAPFEACANLLVGEQFPSLNLRETFLDLTQKPIVVLNRPLDGFKRQPFRSDATSIGRAGELGLQVRRQIRSNAWVETRLNTRLRRSRNCRN